jgi:hypothetical protein
VDVICRAVHAPFDARMSNDADCTRSGSVQVEGRICVTKSTGRGKAPNALEAADWTSQPITIRA